MTSKVTMATGALAVALLTLGVAADRAFVGRVRAARAASLSEADETARMAALSVRAALARLETAIVSGGHPESTVVSRAVPPRRNLPRHGLDRPYRDRSAAELLGLVRESRQVTGSGLPEAVVAALAARSMQAREIASRRLLAGDLPVDPDDLPYVAEVLEIKDHSPIQALDLLRSLPVDSRTDLFSLSCVLYEMINGSPPFRRKTVPATLAAILTEPAPPLPPTTAPRGVWRCLSRGLEKDPDARFQSAEEMSFALHSLIPS